MTHSDPSEVQLSVLAERPTLSVRQTVAIAELTAAQGASLERLWQFIDTFGIEPAGPPFVRYHTFGTDRTDVEVGVAAATAESGDDRVLVGSLPAGPAATLTHVGSHDTLSAAYERLSSWIAEHGHSEAGRGWEVYEWIDLRQKPDPATWAPPSTWRTQLVQPLTLAGSGPA